MDKERYFLPSIPQPIPYQGSKRAIADEILEFAPTRLERIVEPFAGSAALSITAALRGRAKRFLLNDLNAPLMALMDQIVNHPNEIGDRYTSIWQAQTGRTKAYYNEVREEFNRTHDPGLLLYLLARCVKASVRYNASGDFNQGPDNRRLGRRPSSMRQEISAVSRLLIGKTEITSLDYRALLDRIDPGADFVYMDPPYQGTSTTRDPRYFSSLNVHDLILFLERLNHQGVMYALSYDGHKAGKAYGIALPDRLSLLRFEINAGRSSQSTLLGRDQTTYESLYLSPTLANALNATNLVNTPIVVQPIQYALL